MHSATTDQIAEALAEVLLDLPSFGELLQIKAGKKFIDFGWHNWRESQRLFEKHRTGRDIIVKPRQDGFSTMEMARDLQYALINPGARVLIVTHKGSEKSSFFRRLKLMHRCVHELGLCPKPKYSTKTELVFEHNHSSIEIVEAGVTEESADDRGRSGTIDRLHATELAKWRAADATWGALMGACEHGDEIVIESTANGIGNLFHTATMAAQRGEFAGFKLHFYPWFTLPSRSDDPALYPTPSGDREAEWAEAHRKLGVTAAQMAWWWSRVQATDLDTALQEYPPTLAAAFRTSGETWIEPRYLDALAGHAREPRFSKDFQHKGKPLGSLRVYEPPRERHGYVIGADVSEGIGRDRSAATVLHHRTGDVVASYHNDGIEAGDFGILLTLIGAYYNNAWLAPERENDGKATLSAIRNDTSYSKVYRDRGTGKLGWSTNGNTRPILWSDLRRDIEAGTATTPDAETIAEATSIVRDKSGRPAARGKGSDGGAKDDLFVSWAIARQVRSLVSALTDNLVRPGGKPTVSSTFRT